MFLFETQCICVLFVQLLLPFHCCNNCVLSANGQINAVGIKLGLLPSGYWRFINVNLCIRELNKRVPLSLSALCFRTLTCPRLLLPGTRDTHSQFWDSPRHSGTVITLTDTGALTTDDQSSLFTCVLKTCCHNCTFTVSVKTDGLVLA